MKITKNQLSQIIKEELQRIILEKSDGDDEEGSEEDDASGFRMPWDTADQDNQDAQHTPWASSKESAIEWIEEHTQSGGVGTQDTIALVTLLIDRIKSSGGDEDESWEEVSSFFEERLGEDTNEFDYDEGAEETLRVSAPTGKIPYRHGTGHPLGPQDRRYPPHHRKKK